MGYVLDLHRPVAGDVIDLILADHRLFEELLRALRDSSANRDEARAALAAVLVAHAEAEEKYVYPKLRRRDAVDEEATEHSEEEHAEGHEALLKVLELKGTDTKAFSDAVEELSGTINHHLAEEELTILNPARDEVSPQVRAELGRQFLEERQRQIEADCGRVENVRRLVERAKKQGKLDD
ncbi:hemerythrin domain-containing protein [Actinophytocola sp. KF-1]